MIVLLVQVDRRNLLIGIRVEQSSLLRQVNNLQRLQALGELSRRHIRIDIENLSFWRLSHRREDWQTPSINRRLNRPLVDLVDLAHQVPLLLIQVIGTKHTARDRSSAHAHLLQLLHQLQVLLEKQLARDRQRLAVRDADPLLELRLDARILEELVELRPGAVDDDGEEADVGEEGEGRGELVEVLGDDGAADLDDGELLGRDGGEVREVLLDLALRADVAEELDDRRAGRGVGAGRGVVPRHHERRGDGGLGERGREAARGEGDAPPGHAGAGSEGQHG